MQSSLALMPSHHLFPTSTRLAVSDAGCFHRRHFLSHLTRPAVEWGTLHCVNAAHHTRDVLHRHPYSPPLCFIASMLHITQVEMFFIAMHCASLPLQSSLLFSAFISRGSSLQTCIKFLRNLTRYVFSTWTLLAQWNLYAEFYAAIARVGALSVLTYLFLCNHRYMSCDISYNGCKCRLA